jgi:hypothetical protein
MVSAFMVDLRSDLDLGRTSAVGRTVTPRPLPRMQGARKKAMRG